MNERVLGLHHVTAISGPAQENYRFYVEELGLRLVKKTVNFDDPGVYHLYYGDRTGSPGTLLTFFPYGGTSTDHRGGGQVSATSYPVRNLGEWQAKLKEFQRETRFGQDYLLFQDPHGMALELFESESAPESLGPIGGATLKVNSPTDTARLLEFLGFQKDGEEGERWRYRILNGDFLDILRSSKPSASGGVGSVHHIALRVADDEAQVLWRKKLMKAGYRVSTVMDRNYFRSIYFRGPSGVLFEIATDPPGMLVDEEEKTLGQKLMLPQHYESRRQQIEASLDPLPIPQEKRGS